MDTNVVQAVFEPRMNANEHENVRGWRAWARPRGVLQIPVCYLHYVDFPERESIHHVDFQEIQPSQSSYAGP